MEIYNISYKNNKFNISASTWRDKFEFSDESYSVSDVQNYFGYIIKQHEPLTDNLQMIKKRMYSNKIENRITIL